MVLQGDKKGGNANLHFVHPIAGLAIVFSVFNSSPQPQDTAIRRFHSRQSNHRHKFL
jgi:hypothetical protein